ncbi:MAG: TatD family hydrolase [Candidatus Omnitrophica bacterium]|nr:TatD family hydrolase [Candidatus Omnitrophota bacterium]
MQLIDTHCHLDFPQFNIDRDSVIERAKNSGITNIIDVGASIESSEAAIALSKQYDFIYAAVGVHPHEADRLKQGDWLLIEKLISQDKVIAVGEVGLDYYRNLSSPARQKDVFKRFILLANKFSLPLIVHCREAEEDVLSLLKDNLNTKAIMHCFSGNEAFLKRCLDLGLYVSFTCNATYKKSDNLRNVISLTPRDRFFLETDAPYLAPQTMRGKRNEPAYLKYLVAELASILKLDEETIADETTKNAKRFFNLERCQ